MRTQFFIVAGVVLFVLGSIGCSGEPANKVGVDQGESETTGQEATDQENANQKNAMSKKMSQTQLDDAIYQAVKEYQGFGKVVQIPYVAPTLCKAPLPQSTFLSKSEDTDSHGKKIYYLFAKDKKTYLNEQTAPKGQTIVKESWLPVYNVSKSISNSRIVGKGKQTSLFVMTKLGKGTAGTDNGWIYGTVDPKTMKVTSAGLIDNCMGCHQEAGEDRLFGLKEATAVHF